MALFKGILITWEVKNKRAIRIKIQIDNLNCSLLVKINQKWIKHQHVI